MPPTHVVYRPAVDCGASRPALRNWRSTARRLLLRSSRKPVRESPGPADLSWLALLVLDACYHALERHALATEGDHHHHLGQDQHPAEENQLIVRAWLEIAGSRVRELLDRRILFGVVRGAVVDLEHRLLALFDHDVAIAINLGRDRLAPDVMLLGDLVGSWGKSAEGRVAAGTGLGQDRTAAAEGGDHELDAAAELAVRIADHVAGAPVLVDRKVAAVPGLLGDVVPLAGEVVAFSQLDVEAVADRRAADRGR